MSSSESSRRFHFIREIASGGFGSVYLTKVIHADGFSRLVAVKLLHPRWSENEEIASRMRDEARLLGWLRHKNIVDVMDLTLIDGRCAIIMEYLEAIDTKVVINDCVETKTAVPLRAALEMCAAVASALDAAYNRPPYAGEKPLRVIHRDIKPSNIMVDDSGVVKVLDFGVARAEFDERESKTQELAFGSLEYMPPERLFFEPESPASDVYSLGATLYELLALEKFGKAKLRAKEHEAFFEDRFDVLLDQRPLNRESEDLLHDLLMGMLAFDEPDRPSAADCVSRMRSFARRIQENPLEEWAENRVPALLSAIRDREEPKSPGSLVGTVLVEDVRALDQRSIWEENTGMSTRAVDLAGLDEDLTGSLAEDARWKALKQATIEEMAKKGELGLARRPPDAPATVKNPTSPPEELTPTPRPDAPSLGNESPTPSATVRIARPSLDDSAIDTGRTLAISRSSLPRQAVDASLPLEEPIPEEAGMRRLALTAAVVFFLAAGLSMVAFAAVGVVVALILLPQRGDVRDPVPMPVPTELPAPLDLGLPPPVALVSGPKATFVSAFEGTTRLVVSCGESQSSSGVSSVELPGDSLGTCTVRGRAGSTRLFATLNDVEGRQYTCFADDQRTCN